MIVEMARVRVLGPRRLLPDVIDVLMDAGLLQLDPLPLPIETWVGGVPVRGDPDAQRRLAEAARRLEEIQRVLPAAGAVSVPPATLPDPAAPELGACLDGIAAEVKALDERRAALEEERSVLDRYQKVMLALAPEIARLADSKQVEAFGLVFRRGEREAMRRFQDEAARLAGGTYSLVLRELDAEHVAGLLVVPRALAPAVGQLLFQRGVGEVKLPERYAGRSFAEGVKLLIARRSEIRADAERCEAERRELGARWREPVRATLREARNRLTRTRAATLCGETRHTFVVAGWAPTRRLGDLERRLRARFGGDVVLFHAPPDLDEADAVPVLLENPRWLQPFELLLALQPLPRYGSIDPTPFVAFFFPLAFGIILGDVGNGVLALAVALLALRFGWGGALGRRAAGVAIACAVSAIGFGVLFGELFGELGRYVGLQPILFDRRRALLPLLALVLGVGCLQIGLGLVLGFVAFLRQRKLKEACARLVTLATLAAAIVALLGTRGLVAAEIAGGAEAALAVLAVAAVALEGLLAPLELLRTLGNVLSYARLMAVGLASVMLAEVANRLAETLRPLAIGVGLAVLLHALNFTLGLLSPVIQALRLQYVEFFDKFFVPGGRPFAPLSAAT